MDARCYNLIFMRGQQGRLSGLGILPNQESRLYLDPQPISGTMPTITAGVDEVLAYVQRAGFTDIVLTSTGPVVVGPAEIVYRYSPRAVIEGELNPFMGYPSREQVLNFWKTVYGVLEPKLKIKELKSLISPKIAVIPDPGGPNTDFFSIKNRRFYGPVPPPEPIVLCAPVAREKYSDVNGPVQIVTPAGEKVYAMHSVNSKDLTPITACRGLAWPSFAVRQRLHQWPSLVTFYLDTRILYRNLGYTGYSPTRQKGVHFAAWDNWTLRLGDYEKFEQLYRRGLTVGNNGDGFIAAEYLAVGLDTTKFENTENWKDLAIKGKVYPIHTWDQFDDSARNLAAVSKGLPTRSRFPNARYEELGLKSYVEMKVVDFIPLSDIPMCVVHESSKPDANTKRYTTQKVIDMLRAAGFQGDILIAKYDQKDKYLTVDALVEQYVKEKKKSISTYPSVRSGLVPEKKDKAVIRGAKFITLPGGLIMSDIEVTQQLYQSVMGNNPAFFKGDLNKPVENVSWYDAVKFCNELTRLTNEKFGYNRTPAYTINGDAVTWNLKADGWRLPTETEWEYAAKAGGWQDPYGDIDQIAWTRENSLLQTHPVGQKEPNRFGLYDMLGNVWEWNWSSSGSSRVIRGGSWYFAASDARAGLRNRYTPGYRYSDIGFRICRNAPGYTPKE
jgi:sulfatase modifying factor 1